MALLHAAHKDVGGDVVSGGGTGTFDINIWCTEIQAGSYSLMDTTYAKLGLPFRPALWVQATIISVSRKGWFVADCGLKALGMDHGDPSVDAGEVLFCSDEHVTVRPEPGTTPRVGDRVRIWPAHVDPTIALHERMHVVDGDAVVETWEVDLRGWSE
jgi:D-serine deaminase-like pyridoxal phosphate-dependent protein